MMTHKKHKLMIDNIFSLAGITINGDQPWDLTVHDERFYQQVLRDKSIGFGESYMQGWWDCPQLDALITRVFQAKLTQHYTLNWKLLLQLVKHALFNYQSAPKSWEVGQQHYDIGNELYQAMLDPTLSYSCGYWRKASNLDEAQFNKLDLICRKLQLKSGQSVLDIGCGWGGLARHMAQHYGVTVTGLTISKEQYQYAQQHCHSLPITILLQDYRTMNEKFDHIVSVGMFEHVGQKNYKTFFKVCERNLNPGGLLLLHTIGSATSGINTDPWINKYIFPNGMIPSMKQISSACEPFFLIEDLHNFSADYDKTLLCWFNNFHQAWPTLSSHYDETFYRMWKFYLLSCAGIFRARDNQLWQIVLSSNGVSGGYQSIR